MPLHRRPLHRREVLRHLGIGALTLPLLRTAPAAAQQTGAQPSGPPTPFEARGGTDWTTAEEELAFFDALAGAPNPFTTTEIGRTGVDGRPLHLFHFGTDDRGGVAVPASRPTAYVVCSQHGNEPAGREAGLQLIRDLAFTGDPALLALLRRSSVIITPTANPDGRARDARGNGRGVDINRDHLNLTTEEARALAEAGNLHKPYLVVDHHEYGPGQPVLYDDDVLYLWPRNLNVDPQVRAGAKAFCLDYVKADCEAAGFTADEYGLAKVGPNYGPLVTPLGMPTGVQTAGDSDDGIARNAAGLRNTMGVLVESAVSARLADPTELTGNLVRRVASQRVVMDATLRHLAERGREGMRVTRGAGSRQGRAGREQAAVFFDGQDEAHPSQDPASLAPQTVDDPGARRYRFPSALLAEPLGEGGGTLAGTLGLHEVDVDVEGDEAVVSLGQPSRGVIPLLLDGRGRRHQVAGTPDY